jgi:nuclear pore complex protein Nup98-Nup96
MLILPLPGAFGNTTNNAFGAKPAFGTATTSSGGLFGSGTATAGTSGFGGFGATNTTTSTGFGANNSGGGLFGAAKPAFGAPAATSNPFGGAATSSPFGATTTGAFGAPASTALSAGTGECQGTGSVPFQAFVEKEPNSSTNQQNAFQNICFQQPYQKFSPEELRLADYNQGRRYGNASNQAGAFGQTNFGGFGQTNTGFGATNTNTGTTSLFGGGATSTPFGTSQPASTGFGANTATTGGGLFGAAKPAGGLFGAQPTTQPTGGLFGNTASTGFGGTATGFGATNTNTTTGSSLFGNNASTANKPAFSFGNTQPAASTGTGFGASTTTTGAFGGGLFGNNTQQNATTGFGAPAATNNAFGGFGNNNQQQTGTTSLFGGNTQQKPATGLFGAPAATTGGGLFGNTAPAANPSPFGNSTTAQGTGGLFGPKPATSTGLFGATNNQTSTTTTGGLFGGFGGNTQPQQQTTSTGLFGGLNNNQQKPSLFNTGAQQQGGTSLFGNSGNQQQSNSLFGGLNSSQQGQQQQQQPQNSLFGSNSIFGGSQQGQQNQSLTASISDPTALGGSFFAGLGTNQVSNPGPLATPLSSSVKSKKNAALPMYKLNSASASRFTTPQKQRGFGFSYSTYGTPNSAASTSSTPGTFGGSLLSAGSGNTFGRTLSKSISTSSLRRSFSTEDSILAPGAFSASPNTRHFGSTGSVKRLTISRNIRQDLFSPPNPQSQPAPSSSLGGILKKRVSFDANVNGNTNGNPNPLKQVSSATPSAEDLGFMRPRSNGSSLTSNGNGSGPEMEQVSNPNNQLAIVNEEEPVQVSKPRGPFNQEDKEAGEYWMKPTKEEIENMSRAERQSLKGLTVGMRNIGQVTFDAPVDLTKINLDDIMGTLVEFRPRVCTVYPVSVKKPPMGQGLNQPSTISLDNSWPRKNGKQTPGKDLSGSSVIKKHIERLKRVPDTNFVRYDVDTGVWTFTVEHFTTYGYPEDEDEEDEFGQSTLSLPPNTPTPKTRSTPRSVEQSFVSTSQVTESDPEDTFDFRRKKALPGAFDDEDVYVDDEAEVEYEDGQNSFLDERSVGSQSEDGVEEPMDQDDVFQDDESVSVMDQEMAGSYPEADNTAELDEDSQDGDVEMGLLAATPGAIMRARMRAIKSGTPMKQNFAAGDDWANTLQATISPKKQDRALLKSLIDIHGNDSRLEAEPTPTAKRIASDGRGFATSIDLMNSLFGQARSPVKVLKVPAKSKGFEVGFPSLC